MTTSTTRLEATHMSDGSYNVLDRTTGTRLGEVVRVRRFYMQTTCTIWVAYDTNGNRVTEADTRRDAVAALTA